MSDETQEAEIRFHTVVMPSAPSWGVIAALSLLRRYGEDRGFAGIDDEKVESVFNDSPPDAVTAEAAEDAESKGILHLGVGAGRFGGFGHDLPEKVAEAMGIRTWRSLFPLLDYSRRIARRDREVRDWTEKGPFHLADAVRRMHEGNADDPEYVVEWLDEYLQIWLEQQEGFFNKGTAAFRAAQKEVFGLDAKNEPLVLVVAESPHIELKRYAFSRLGGHTAALVQRAPSGKINVFLNQLVADRANLSLDRIAAKLRAAEIEAHGTNPPEDIELLMGEGWLSDAPNWRYIPPIGAIFDGEKGSEDHTELSLGAVSKIVKQELAAQAAKALLAAHGEDQPAANSA